jgi:hypothetical protein
MAERRCAYVPVFVYDRPWALAISVDEDGRREAVNPAWQGVVENTDTRPYYEMVSEALYEAWQRWGRDE